MRPERLLLVCGTRTEVGKTWVTAQLLAQLRAAGVRVAARKPVQSYDERERESTDADVLAAATGEAPTDVCPPHRWYSVPMAPPMAADVLGRPAVRLGDLVAELSWPSAPAVQVGAIETVGGVRSPLASDGDARSLAAAIKPDVVLLVADAGLGTINDVRLSIGALEPHPTVVLLNRYDAADDLHCRNRRWLIDVDGFDVVADVAELAARLSAATYQA